jgi:hypothetical protein
MKMKNLARPGTALAALLLLLAAHTASAEQIMTYQGRLRESNVPVTGTRPIFMRFCTSPTGGCPFSTGAQVTDISGGLFRTTFTVPGDLDLSSALSSSTSWYMEVVVNGFSMSPRELLNFSPYAGAASSSTYLVGALGEAGVRVSTSLILNPGMGLYATTLQPSLSTVNGSSLTIRAGDTPAGAAGDVLVKGGTGNNGTAGGGSVILSGGSTSGTSSGGSVTINAGASSNTGSGGGVSITAGAAPPVGANPAGGITLTGGAGSGGSSGSVTLTGGSGGTAAGAVNLQGGFGPGVQGGAIGITAGNSNTAGGGAVNITAGAGISSAGGIVNISAGNGSTGGGAFSGGALNLTGGSANTGAAGGTGGSVILKPGAPGNGATDTVGRMWLDGTTAGTAHFKISGPVPTLTANANCGTGSPNATGTDTAGLFTFSTTGAGAAGCVFTLTFKKPYTVAPSAVLITPASQMAAGLGAYVDNPGGVTTTKFDVRTNGIPAAGQNYFFYFWVIE